MTEHTQGAEMSASGRPSEAAVVHADEEGGRVEYLDRLKAQIRQGVYRPDVKDLARSLATMMVRDL